VEEYHNHLPLKTAPPASMPELAKKAGGAKEGEVKETITINQRVPWSIGLS